jgi:hypothetical protein
MRKALRFGKMDKDMKEIINKVRRQDLVNLNGQMILNMRGNY